MMTNSRLLSLLLAASLLTFACKKTPPAEEIPSEAEKVEEARKVEEAPADELDASMASTSGTSDPACVGPIEAGEPETITIGGRTFELNGHALRLQGESEGEPEVKVGVIANINQATAANLFNIGRYLEFFAENGVELILVAGDSGEDRANIETVLGAVAESGLPVVAIAGNRERTKDFVDAILEVRKTRNNLFNGNQVRLVSWHGLDVITLPGYHDPRYIHQEPGDGCRYFLEDVQAVGALAKKSTQPVLLLAHGQPKGSTPTALDVIAPGKEHIGDVNLNEAIEGAGIPFGIFANVKEAGGQAISQLSGEKVVEANAWSNRLYLNPGAADAVEWPMNDGSSSTGMVAVFHLKGKEASHSIYKAPKLTDAEKAEAEKLVPGEAAAQAD